VKWYSLQKGYGFIRPEDDQGEVFVHASDLRKTGLTALESHAEVEFEVSPPREEGGRRRARNVRVLSVPESVESPEP
jgi:CspA family cold shock protein